MVRKCIIVNIFKIKLINDINNKCGSVLEKKKSHKNMIVVFEI